MLTDRNVYPDNTVLSMALGSAFSAWQSLEERLKADPKITLEWRYYNDTNCWLAKVQFKKKTFIWIQVHEGCFRCAFHFASTFADVIQASALPVALKGLFHDSAAGKKNGTVTLFVKVDEDLAPYEELFRLKKLYHFGA
jgi:alpha-D-ribose 1-methylphosphonate 5-triphosphate synthase subunit PhnH